MIIITPPPPRYRTTRHCIQGSGSGLRKIVNCQPKECTFVLFGLVSISHCKYSIITVWNHHDHKNDQNIKSCRLDILKYSSTYLGCRCFAVYSVFRALTGIFPPVEDNRWNLMISKVRLVTMMILGWSANREWKELFSRKHMVPFCTEA